MAIIPLPPVTPTEPLEIEVDAFISPYFIQLTSLIPGHS
jgi:hypothetical protein